MASTAGGAHFSHHSSGPSRRLLRADNLSGAITESYSRTGRLSLLVAAVQPFDQLAFSSMLPSIQNIELIQCLGNLETVLQICPGVAPDVVIIDVSFAGGASYQAGRELLERRCTKSIAFFDFRFALHRARKALTCGIGACYFTRALDLKQLSTCLTTRANIENIFISNVEQLPTFDKHQFLTLSTQELHVLQWLANGHSVRSIAEKMGLAESTVDNHKARMMKKLMINKTSHLVRLAVETGLIDWESK
jgi:DNA-binding NarL/FixJ family response regulator